MIGSPPWNHHASWLRAYLGRLAAVDGTH